MEVPLNYFEVYSPYFLKYPYIFKLLKGYDSRYSLFIITSITSYHYIIANGHSGNFSDPNNMLNTFIPKDVLRKDFKNLN